MVDIPEIDERLSFVDKKNICIVNNSSSKISGNFLYSIIVNACIYYHLRADKTRHCNICFESKTILIDAGNGNNLGCIYIELVKKSSIGELDIKKILEQIIVVRAFTLYQLLNIIINKVPIFILQQDGNCKIQIIVMDFLGTLLESSNNIIRTKYKDSQLRSEQDFKNNERLVNEAIDILLNLSNDHFVRLTCENNNWIADDSLFYKFSNHLDIGLVTYHEIGEKNTKGINEIKDTRNELIIKIKSKKTTFLTKVTHIDVCDSNNMSSSSSFTDKSLLCHPLIEN